jgi:hypothetical protein
VWRNPFGYGSTGPYRLGYFCARLEVSAKPIQTLFDLMKLRSRRIGFAALCIVGIGFLTPAPAATITNLVETSSTLNFDFSGLGYHDFIAGSLPPLTYWSIPYEAHAQDLLGSYGIAILTMQHLPGGKEAAVGDATSSAALLGSPLLATTTVSDGSGVDTYSLNITVFNDGNNQWARFTGSFWATHEAANVPDEGGTLLLVSMGLVVLGSARPLFTAVNMRGGRP